MLVFQNIIILFFSFFLEYASAPWKNKSGNNHCKKKNTEDQSTVQEIVEVVKSKFQHVKEDINHSFQEFQTELKQSEEKTTKHRHELMKEDIHNKEVIY